MHPANFANYRTCFISVKNLLLYLLFAFSNFLFCLTKQSGLGEQQTAKFKLRLGLNLKTYKAYAKLRFRAEPLSPFDIGDGVSCAGKVNC